MDAMRYQSLLTLRSSEEINRSAERFAREARRSRSKYIRDLIRVLDRRQDLRQTIKTAILETED